MPGRRVMTNKKFNELNLNNVTSLKPGEDYNDLKPNYVIFICTFDPFGKKLYRYTYENYCRETNLPLEDGTTKIFLNTKGKNQQLHVKIQQLKKSREWEGRYMKFEELLRKAETKGEDKGTSMMLKLIRRMSENGEAASIPRLSQDKNFLTEMLQKYHLNI